MPRLLPVLALAACQPVFELQTPLACPVDWVVLEGGLTDHLSHSDDGGWTFDYAPDRPNEARVVGDYDLESGDFSWTRSYDDTFWITQEKVEGEGTAYQDGDLDAAYTRQLVDRTGPRQKETVRHVRLGCDVELDVSRGGEPFYLERGTLDEDGYVYTRTREQDGALIEVEGELEDDFTRTETEAWRIDDVQLEQETVTEPDGVVTRAFDRLDPDEHRFGEEVIRRNGVRVFDFTVETAPLVAVWSYDRDLDGDGEGEVEFRPRAGSPYTCDVSLNGGDCTVDCGSGKEACE